MSGPTTLVVPLLSIALLAGCAPAKHHAAQVFGGGTAPRSYAGIAGGIGTQSGVSPSSEMYRAFEQGTLLPYPTMGFYDGGYNVGVPLLSTPCYDENCVQLTSPQSWGSGVHYPPVSGTITCVDQECPQGFVCSDIMYGQYGQQRHRTVNPELPPPPCPPGQTCFGDSAGVNIDTVCGTGYQQCYRTVDPGPPPSGF